MSARRTCLRLALSGLFSLALACGSGAGPAFDGGTASDGGSACDGGNGSPSCSNAPVVVTTFSGVVSWMTADDTDLFWTSGQDVLRCPKAGCGTPTLLASGQPNPVAIAVSGANLFWVNNTGANIVSCPKADCAGGPTPLFTTSFLGMQALAVNDTDVYFGGSTPTGQGQQLTNAIWRCSVTGCGAAPTKVCDLGAYYSWSSMWVDGSSVYWESGAAGFPILSCPLAGSAAPDVLYAQNGNFPSGARMAIDDSRAYWYDDLQHAIVACSKGGCGQSPTVLTSGAPTAYAFALDATYVYWVDSPADTGNLGRVLRCSKSGCGFNPTVLAVDPLGARNLLVDSANIYWSSANQIVRLMK